MGTKHPSPVKLPSHPWGLEYRYHDERGMVGRETHADSTRLDFDSGLLGYWGAALPRQ